MENTLRNRMAILETCPECLGLGEVDSPEWKSVHEIQHAEYESAGDMRPAHLILDEMGLPRSTPRTVTCPHCNGERNIVR